MASDGNIVLFSGTSGKLVKDSGLAFSKYYITSQYLGGQTYNSVTLSVTATSGTLVRGVFIPYQTLDGAWRLKLNFTMSFSPAVTNPTVTIAGITTKNIVNYYQGIFCGEIAGQYNPGQAVFNPNANSCSCILISASLTSLQVQGELELDSKPTWLV